MHETTRKLFCRISFVIVCLFPTMSTGLVCLYRATPWYADRLAQHWERRLEDRVGLIANVERVRFPVARTVLLERVTLADPDTLRLVATIRLLEFVEDEQGLHVRAAQPEVEVGQFLRIWEAFHQRVLKGGPIESPVRLAAQELTLQGDFPQTFTDVSCALDSDVDGITSTIRFRLAGLAMATPAELQIVRNRRVYPPATGWHLRTGPSSLPCALFGPYIPTLAAAGSKCRFRGTVWADESDQGWSGELAGEFEDVDLGRLMEPFAHKLSGNARLNLGRAQFDRGRLREAVGNLECFEGVIAVSLVESLGQVLGLEIRLDSQQRERRLVPFDSLIVGFELNPNELRIRGLCDSHEPGTLLATDQSPLLVGNALAIPAVAMAHALSPQSRYLVPVTRETNILVQMLPIPDAREPARFQVARPHSRVRLRDNVEPVVPARFEDGQD